MTRLFLAAGVAALAIAAPTAAKPGGGHGGDKGGQQAAATQQGGGGGGQRAKSVERRAGGGGFAVQRAERSQRFSGARAERSQRFSGQRAERGQRFAAFQGRGEQARGKATRVERTTRVNRAERRANVNRIERQQVRAAERQKLRVNRTERANRLADRQTVRGNRELRLDKRAQRVENRMAVREQLRGNRALRVDRVDRINDRIAVNNVRGFGLDCPPGLMSKGCMPPGHGINAARRIANADAFRTSRLAALAGTRILAPTQVVPFVGTPLSTLSNVVALSALPSSVAYLYPDTNDYYYRYGNGYLYEVDRDTSLISALLPLLAGGLLPGQYLPTSYMNSYVPNYYGLNSFYPASYGYNSGYGYNPGYGYNSGYGYNTCNRYANGVIYQVDCVTGMIIDVIPMYAGGYGVGQLLPSSYGYYNVPNQYRSLYYNTPDYNYWYAPGAIYQYDPGSSMITSVAALLSPGFTIGQQLPMGYSAYNVPYGYRDMYYDTPNAWYRYNNGYIYQVDPMTQLVTAIVASILT